MAIELPTPNLDGRISHTTSGSCVDYRIIGVINLNTTQTLYTQLAFAGNATYQLVPGDPFPSETPVPRPAPGSGPSYSDSNSGGGGGGGSSGGLRPRAIAGIAIGAGAVLIAGAGLIYLYNRRHRFEKAYRKSAQSCAV
ncbi:uncharacterized protein B0T15DRAFT_512355 [Chaetomium strumarium]|uniref:Uncharacterized protein n=1 Tax=Chaetomium strumarium TaxID=1170767 RepID=A0AAJ0GQB9_9PEZI|nr:hypothetical protein B0T15DRAFT_512355 [Chaetomium strumarium]